MSSPRSERVVNVPGGTVRIRPARDQTAGEIADDLRRTLDLHQSLRESGVKEWKSTFHTFGRVRVAWTKEVGPPPWRFPRIRPFGKLRPPHLSVTAGWRSTAYSIHLVLRDGPDNDD